MESGVSVDHRFVELLVPQQLLDARHRAAGVEQLGGGVMQAVGGDVHPTRRPAALTVRLTAQKR